MENHNLLGIALSIVGAIAAYLNKWMNGEPFSVVRLAATAFVGGFVGALGGLFAIILFPGNDTLILFVSGASGAIGYDAVKPMWDRFLSTHK